YVTTLLIAYKRGIDSCGIGKRSRASGGDTNERPRICEWISVYVTGGAPIQCYGLPSVDCLIRPSICHRLRILCADDDGGGRTVSDSVIHNQLHGVTARLIDDECRCSCGGCREC